MKEAFVILRITRQAMRGSAIEKRRSKAIVRIDAKGIVAVGIGRPLS
jgi:hypothetical protein